MMLNDEQIAKVSDFEPILEDTDSPYQVDAKPISDELARQVCELLGLNPDNTNAITIEAGTLNHGVMLIVRSVKRNK